jgi:hypothetical protein
MWVASGVSITRTISNSTRDGNTSNSRRPPPKSNEPRVRSLAPTTAGGSSGVVADIAKLSVGREAYYTRELATDHEQDLSGRGESPGAVVRRRHHHPRAGRRRPLSARPTLRAVDFEADRAAQVLIDPDVVVVPIVAVHGAQVPWGKVVTQGVPVVTAKRLPSMLRQLPAVQGPERITALADQARIRFHAAA